MVTELVTELHHYKVTNYQGKYLFRYFFKNVQMSNNLDAPNIKYVK